MRPEEKDVTPTTPHARELSEDDSDESRLHQIIREETERRAPGRDDRKEREPGAGEGREGG